MFHRVASGPAWSEALARVALKGLPVALHAHSDLHVYRENKKHYEMVGLISVFNIGLAASSGLQNQAGGKPGASLDCNHTERLDFAIPEQIPTKFCNSRKDSDQFLQ